MKLYYHPELGLVDHDYDEELPKELHSLAAEFLYEDPPYTKSTTTPFHTGDDEPAKIFACRKCGRTELNVGRDGYVTVIRCPKCKWEWCIHEG